MKATLIALLAAASLSAASYDIADILTASTVLDTRAKDWKPGDGLALEVSGMDWTADGKLALSIRKGEVWVLDGVLDAKPNKVSYKLFASGLHEPLGLLRDGKDLLVTQRTETTRLRDTNGDGVADEYLTAGAGWNVSGAYHGYAYGPKRDGLGQLWVTLNVDMGDHANNMAPWRLGWRPRSGRKIHPHGGRHAFALRPRHKSRRRHVLRRSAGHLDSDHADLPPT